LNAHPKEFNSTVRALKSICKFRSCGRMSNSFGKCLSVIGLDSRRVKKWVNNPKWSVVVYNG